MKNPGKIWFLSYFDKVLALGIIDGYKKLPHWE